MNTQLLVWSGIAFAIGWGAASFYNFQKTDDSHMKIVRNKEWKGWGVLRSVMYILAVVAFLGVVFQSVTFTYEQRQCNTAVIDTIKYRAELSSADAALNDARAQALKDLVDSVISSTAIRDEYERGQFVRGSFTEYQETIAALNAEKAENEKKRQERPYPDCE